MERYLDNCLKSLLISEGLDQVEVLIINDGSRDSSSDIAKYYIEQYPNVFSLIEKENGNYGSCINRGIKEASGKYIKILDADDSFDTDSFSKFLHFLNGTDADLIISSFWIVNSEGEMIKRIDYKFKNGITMPFSNVCSTELFRNNIQMHAVTYRLSILRDLNYRQTEGISYTDQQWICIPMIGIKTVAFIDEPVYKYLVGRDGQTMDLSVKARSIGQIAKCSIGMIQMYESYKPSRCDSNLLVYLHARILYYAKEVYVSCFSRYDKETKDILNDYDSRFKEASPELYSKIESKETTSIAGIPYLKLWRNNRTMSSFAIGIASSVYLHILKMKRKFSMTNDSMSMTHGN
ncbi:MAG: glycosyltransferase family 2 protein [Bacteroidales bacterium]|nr:glycosyltransferase family 2 protein [Bacteroidales bacterium]